MVKYDGSVEKAFAGRIIDVTNTELYKEFKVLADLLNALYQRGVINKYAFDNNFYRTLYDFLPTDNFEKKIYINEENIFYYLRKNNE